MEKNFLRWCLLRRGLFRHGLFLLLVAFSMSAMDSSGALVVECTRSQLMAAQEDINAIRVVQSLAKSYSDKSNAVQRSGWVCVDADQERTLQDDRVSLTSAIETSCNPAYNRLRRMFSLSVVIDIEGHRDLLWVERKRAQIDESLKTEDTDFKLSAEETTVFKVLYE